MAYSLKSVQYKNQQRNILLQNENGPCPLLAAANALLLSAQITLPPSSVRNNVASIDDVVNMLAGHALRQHVDHVDNQSSNHIDSISNTDNCDMSGQDNANAAATAHHIDELLELFPTLQHGMDVNPKFTLGPSGYEYTNGLGAFDIMGVDLVHGWLLDIQQDSDAASIIGVKSYNELVEIVVKGNEAMEKADTLRKKINDILSQEGSTKLNGPNQQSDAQDGITDSTNEVHKMQQEFDALNDSAKQGLIVKEFLESTSHQLTYAGLMELHSHVKEGHLCVFFRNNHFATLTKNEGVLYLLVTDLGYAGVKEVIWEKLDDISGDTELYDECFRKSNMQSINPTSAGPNLTPEQLLAQRGQSEADFQLALELSRSAQNDENALADRESNLIAAATELSLREYNNQSNSTNVDLNGTDDHNNQSNQDHLRATDQETLVYNLQMQMNEARDREVAMQLQAELNAAGARNAAASSSNRRQTLENNRRRTAKQDPGCLIS